MISSDEQKEWHPLLVVLSDILSKRPVDLSNLNQWLRKIGHVWELKDSLKILMIFTIFIYLRIPLESSDWSSLFKIIDEWIDILIETNSFLCADEKESILFYLFFIALLQFDDFRFLSRKKSEWLITNQHIRCDENIFNHLRGISFFDQIISILGNTSDPLLHSLISKGFSFGQLVSLNGRVQFDIDASTEGKKEQISELKELIN